MAEQQQQPKMLVFLENREAQVQEMFEERLETSSAVNFELRSGRENDLNSYQTSMKQVRKDGKRSVKETKKELEDEKDSASTHEVIFTKRDASINDAFKNGEIDLEDADGVDNTFKFYKSVFDGIFRKNTELSRICGMIICKVRGNAAQKVSILQKTKDDLAKLSREAVVLVTCLIRDLSSGDLIKIDENDDRRNKIMSECVDKLHQSLKFLNYLQASCETPNIDITHELQAIFSKLHSFEELTDSVYKSLRSIPLPNLKSGFFDEVIQRTVLLEDVGNAVSEKEMNEWNQQVDDLTSFLDEL